MKVTYLHDHPPYWEVTDSDGRWWSVSYRFKRKDGSGSGTYLITNTQGRVLDAHGPTGQKVLKAVHASERAALREVPDVVTNKRGELL